jgi:formylmethanofuran dehydrogenase subunit B
MRHPHLIADIVLPVKIARVECEGTAYRMDNVPIRQKKVKEATEGLFSDREIIIKLIEIVKERKSL